MSAELYFDLLRFTLAVSAAAMLVLALRPLLRRAFGVRATYAFWWLVPMAGAATLLPVPEQAVLAPLVVALPDAMTPAAAVPVGASSLLPVLLLVWLLGAVALLALEFWRQRRFLRGLGALTLRSDGCLQSASIHAGPAVIGVLRPRVVLPADFETRYSVEERELILGHERVHVLRGDLSWNLIALVLRSLQWFNPLLHLAYVCYRFDQELAADAVVLAQRPQARRCYADAMLKTQLDLMSSPLGCQWQSSHPLKERIAMLKRSAPGTTRRRSGVLLALALGLALGTAAWATQPAPETELDQPVTYARLAPPKYPSSAVEAGEQGTVTLRIEVSEEGVPRQVQVHQSSGSASLDEAAVAAATKWTFNPGRKDGAAVASWILVPLNFALDDSAASGAGQGEAQGEASAPALRALDQINVRGG